MTTPLGPSVSAGQTLNISSGQTSTGVNVFVGGTVDVLSGGFTINSVIHLGGVEQVSAGGVASGSVVSGFGYQYVSSGGSASGTSVASGGIEYVYSGGATNHDSIASGGLEAAYGGTVGNATVSSGGTLELFGGAQLSGTTTVQNGGVLEVGSGESLSGFTVGSGVTLEVASGGFVSNTTVLSGGVLEILSGGVASGTSVSTGGVVTGAPPQTQTVSAGQTSGASSASPIGGWIVLSGGVLNVSSGGLVSGTADGGGENVLSGGIDSAATISSGGYLVVNGGGLASGETVLSGGRLTINGGAIGDALVASGGDIVVSSGGSVSGLNLNNATLELGAGAIVSGALNIQGLSTVTTSSAGGSYDVHSYGVAGTFAGLAYASYDKFYNSTGALVSETFQDAGGNLLGTEIFLTASGSFGGLPFTSYVNSYDASGFRFLKSFYNAGGALVATAGFQASGASDNHYYAAGTFGSTSYASYDNAYDASGAPTRTTYYDAGGATLILETHGAGGVYDIHYFSSPGTFQGLSYASYDNAYSSTNVLTQQTYYDANGAVVGSQSYSAFGGYAITIGGALSVQKIVYASGAMDYQYYVPGSFGGLAYASYDNSFMSNGFRNEKSFYDAGGNLVAAAFFWSDGTSENLYNTGGSFLGATYASYNQQFDASNVLTYETFFAANGGVVGQENFVVASGVYGGLTYASYANGFTASGFRGQKTFYAANGNLVAVATFQTDGSSDNLYYASGSTAGIVYASYDDAFSSSNVLTKTTFYAGDGSVKGVETFGANGAFDIRYYGATGYYGDLAYASFDNAFTSSGFRNLKSFYDANGNLAAAAGFAVDGSSDNHYYESGSLAGVTYASYDNAYNAANVLVQETGYDANGNVVVSETFAAHGAFDVFRGMITGKSYSSYEDIFSAASVKVADAIDNVDGSGVLVFDANGLTTTFGASQMSLQTGADTFALMPHAVETLNATGMTGETFVLHYGFGQDAINGFVATSDILQFDVSSFSYLTAGMTQAQDLAAVLAHATTSGNGANLVIADTAATPDTLTLNGVASATINANPAAVKFV